MTKNYGEVIINTKGYDYYRMHDPRWKMKIRRGDKQPPI
jgi:hypothetical protein